MRTLIFSQYYLTETRGGKTRRYASRFKLSPEDAAKRGLTEADIVPGSSEPREVPEEGESPAPYHSAGHDGVRTPGKE